MCHATPIAIATDTIRNASRATAAPITRVTSIAALIVSSISLAKEIEETIKAAILVTLVIGAAVALLAFLMVSVAMAMGVA